MFRYGLKTNITVTLAILLVVAMILIDFVMIITAQRVLLRSEISKGYFFISGIELSLAHYPEEIKSISNLSIKGNLEKLLNEAGYLCGIVLGTDEHKILLDGQGCSLQRNLEILARQSILSGNKLSRFEGTIWAVFWLQSRHLMLSAPISRKGRIIASAGIVLPLEKIYSSLRQIQIFFYIYLLINTVVLTLAGLYRLSKRTVKPLQRLVKRADEYTEDDEMVFLYEKEDNEFNKLSRALNNMLTHIAADKEKLRTTVKSLEKTNIELKKAQQEVIRAEKLASVGRLSSGIAHEIGNPIGIVTGYLELLKQNDISDEDRREFILRTENEINRIHTIIRQLLDFVRPSSDSSQAVAVHEIVNDIIETVKFQPVMSQIDLRLDLGAQSDTVIADPNQLRQVFLNLLLNAADAVAYAKERVDGRITITSNIEPNPQADTKDQTRVLKVEIIDNGLGIKKENMDNIFDPFYTTKEPGKGTGLGLSVSFMIIEGIGGKIEANSKEGLGTTMAVYLPLS
ncbi:MAG: ATP-binding protein [Candidatus Desulfatibia sp.]|uniref:sensor histidine kinase n=1 Tax=Candidatus Desulfatibia sp. TaxID=3101189 RepID=UPI002F3117DE